MAGHTTHYNLIKPTSAERVAVGDINDNSDIIDGNLFTANERADQMADDYNASETYNTGDYVRRENYLYKCNTDNTTGTWDATKWDRVKVMDEITQGGGGGSSTLAGLDDVSLATPTDGQLLGYNGTSHKWENVNGGGGGSSTLAGLSDVSVSGVANKDIIRYNSTTQKYEKSTALTDLELAVSQISASTLGITNGHTILDSNGTAMAQEDGLQFVGSNVADNGTNGKTVVTNCINVTQAEYDALVANDEDLPDVYYNITDAQPVAVNASNLPYSSSQSTKQKIDEVSTKTDAKLSDVHMNFVRVMNADLTTNMDLTSYVDAALSQNYSFVGFLSMGASDGWIANFPIYLSQASAKAGRPWWSGNIPTAGSVRFYFLEQKVG